MCEVKQNGKVKESLVLGIIGLIGWILPILGAPVGIVATLLLHIFLKGFNK